MLGTGTLLFLSEALKCYGNDSFRAKMVFLFSALVFRFTLYPRLTESWGKLAAVVSLALWFSVGLAGPIDRIPGIESFRRRPARPVRAWDNQDRLSLLPSDGRAARSAPRSAAAIGSSRAAPTAGARRNDY